MAAINSGVEHPIAAADALSTPAVGPKDSSNETVPSPKKNLLVRLMSRPRPVQAGRPAVANSCVNASE
jgi:hypothetical protein